MNATDAGAAAKKEKAASLFGGRREAAGFLPGDGLC